jgi:hypothetical protein
MVGAWDPATLPDTDGRAGSVALRSQVGTAVRVLADVVEYVVVGAHDGLRRVWGITWLDRLVLG